MHWSRRWWQWRQWNRNKVNLEGWRVIHERRKQCKKKKLLQHTTLFFFFCTMNATSTTSATESHTFLFISLSLSTLHPYTRFINYCSILVNHHLDWMVCVCACREFTSLFYNVIISTSSCLRRWIFVHLHYPSNFIPTSISSLCDIWSSR